MKRNDMPEYTAWCGLKKRVYDPNFINRDRYDSLGVTICEGWEGSFKSFLADVGERPSPEHSIDRMNNLGGYWCGHCEECVTKGRPFNVRWATPKEQARNTRRNRLLTVGGITRCFAEWEELTGLPSMTLTRRARRGWPLDASILQPLIQSHERTKRKSKINLTHNGITLSLDEWAKRIGLSYKALFQRLYRDGMTVSVALTTPNRKAKATN